MKRLDTIYLDYQASTPIDEQVIEAMTSYFSCVYGNPHANDHAEGWRAWQGVESALEGLARALSADADEILITSGATEANNLAVLGLARRSPPSRNRILLSSIEHKSVLASAEATRSLGFKVERLPVDRDGLVDLETFERVVRDDVLLVSILGVSNEIGSIQPIPEIARLAHSVGALLHVDGAQAPAACLLNVDHWGVDLLSLSGHKIYGPKGIGALFVRRAVQQRLEPLIYGGGQQRGLRSGTLPVPLCVGFSVALLKMTGERAEEERARVRKLRDRFVAELQSRCAQAHLNGPPLARRHPGNANLRFEGLDARDLLAAAQPQLAASSGSACHSGVEEPSYVLREIGLSREEARSSIRFSLGRFTTEDEVMAAVDIIEKAVRTLSV